MDKDESIRQANALRHLFYVNRRLDLEFRAGLAKLFREYVVSVSDELLSSVILAVPEELMGGFDSIQVNLTAESAEGPQAPVIPGVEGPQAPVIPGVEGPEEAPVIP